MEVQPWLAENGRYSQHHQLRPQTQDITMSVTNKLTPELEELIVSLRLTPEGNRKSTRQISRELKERGHDISHVTVSKVINEHTGELKEKARDIALTALEGSVNRSAGITDELRDGAMGVWRKGMPKFDEKGNQTSGMRVSDWNGVGKQVVSIIALQAEMAGLTIGEQSQKSGSNLSDEELDTRLAQLEAVIETNRRLN